MDDDYKKLDDSTIVKGEKIIVFHGFSKKQLNKVIEAIKKVSEGENIIMAVSTPTSLEWKLKELIEELTKEHEYMKRERE
jgi:lysophospholipid acyltransferase (LPLAT)-like uncharacterized protein